MSKIRIIFILIGVAFLFLTHIGETSYRDWSYGNNIADFGLSNYITSITGTITATFLLLGISKQSIVKYPKSALGVILGCAIYEFLQPILGTGIFDWQDLVAIIVTGSICYVIIYLLAKQFRCKPT